MATLRSKSDVVATLTDHGHTLDLTGSAVGADGAKLIAAFLEDGPAVHKILLPGNGIGDAGVSGIAAALPRCMAVQTVDLSGNGITDAGAAELLAALKEAPSVVELIADKNKISAEVAAQLQQEVDHNKQPDRVQLAAERLTKFEAGLLAAGAAAEIARRMGALRHVDTDEQAAESVPAPTPPPAAAAPSPAAAPVAVLPPPILPKPAALAEVAAAAAAEVATEAPKPTHSAPPLPSAAWLLSRHDITLLKEIGRGEHATAYLAKFNDATVVATELAGTISDAQRTAAGADAGAMKHACGTAHPNVLHYYGTVVDDRGILLVTEQYDLGLLPEYLAAHPTLAPAMRLALCLQIARGMAHLHELKPPVQHHELAAHTVALASQPNGSVAAKVADFGLFRTMPKKENNWAGPGPEASAPTHHLRWAAPEVLSTKTSYLSSDVWSFGVTAWQIFSNGAVPYGQADAADVMDGVIAKKLALAEPDLCPAPVWAVLKTCFAYVAHERPTFHDLVEQLSALVGK